MRRKIAKKLRKQAIRMGVTFRCERWMFSNKEIKLYKLDRKQNGYELDAFYNNYRICVCGEDELRTYRDLIYEIKELQKDSIADNTILVVIEN